MFEIIAEEKGPLFSNPDADAAREFFRLKDEAHESRIHPQIADVFDFLRKDGAPGRAPAGGPSSAPETIAGGGLSAVSNAVLPMLTVATIASFSAGLAAGLPCLM